MQIRRNRFHNKPGGCDDIGASCRRVEAISKSPGAAGAVGKFVKLDKNSRQQGFSPCCLLFLLPTLLGYYKNVRSASMFAHVLCKIKNNSLMFCDLLVEIRSKNGYRSMDPDRSKGKQRQNKVYENADRLGKISGYMLWIQIFCQQHRSRKPDLYIPVFLHVSAEAVYAGFSSGRRTSFLLNLQNNA